MRFVIRCVACLAVPVAAVVEVIWQAPNGTALENSIILHNGSLVVTSETTPAVYRFDITKHHRPPPEVAYTFGTGAACTGVTQPSPDTLAVINGNITLTPEAGGTDWAIVLLRIPAGRPATVLQRFAVPDATFLNGLTFLSGSPHILLFADSRPGSIYRLDTRTGRLDAPFTGAAYQPTEDNDPALGANGVHARPSALYFNNINRGLVGRVPVDPHTGALEGPPVPVLRPNATLRGLLDDFALAVPAAAGHGPDRAFPLYVALIRGDGVARLDGPGARLQLVAGGRGDPLLRGATSVQVASPLRRRGGAVVLYVTTLGAPPGEPPAGRLLRVTLP